MEELDSAARQRSSQALPGGICLEGLVIESVLGSGPFSNTYLARDVALGKHFVLKEHLPVALCYRDPDSLEVVPREIGDKRDEHFAWSVENFRREAETLASLNHPGIVRVLGGFEHFGTAYIAMPFVEGASLEEQIRLRHAHGPEFTDEELHGLLWRLLEPLNFLHEHGISHGGICPENILLNDAGVPSLIGFSGARRRLCERFSLEMEKTGYTPIEQIEPSTKIGPQSDIFALGATLFTAITGNPPAVATRIPLTLRVRLQERYPQPLLASIDKAIRSIPEDRFRDGTEWRSAIWGDLPEEESTTDRPEVDGERLREEQQRAEQQRAEQERAEQEREEQQREEQLREEQLRAEQQRAEQQRAEQLREEQQRLEQQREEQLRAEQERAEQERAEQERAEQERAEQERAEQERAEQARAEQQGEPDSGPSPTEDPGAKVTVNAAPAVPPPPKERPDLPVAETAVPKSSFAARRLAGALVLIGIAAVVVGYLSTREGPPKSPVSFVSAPETKGIAPPPIPAEPEPPFDPSPAPVAAAAIPEPIPAPAPSETTGVEEAKEMEGTRAGEVRIFGGIEMAWCPPGTFAMGSPWNEKGRFVDETPHEVILTRGFWIAKTETTQKQWELITAENPSWRKGENLPVERVAWSDVQHWLEKKNEQDPPPAGWKWSLPTEAQWEYACRAGTTTAIYSGPLEILGALNAPALDAIAWYGGNSSVGYTGPGMDTAEWKEKQYPGGLAGDREVGGKLPNAWGLHDMIGNVWEWCADWMGPYAIGTVVDPTGPTTGKERAMRGGSWGNGPELCRSAVRNGNPGDGGDGLGFRCVIVPSEIADL